ncbi:hypothetical protein U5801_21400 [Lamprobacter modestohalophilus]|uniref:hypothetical protein n=1 Tax=Lamprobacter modestohalophilus TaxID=1064514 RepID=UPI002ADECB57|nr:hypothetical protein [Lamprobacter modestohalophilus]MEA1052341.1 hypothetical protein [Lamprobacter modestohalophilus]
MTQPAIDFNCNAFFNTHGEMPKGRGSWMFQITEINAFEGEGRCWETPVLPYAHAKAWVKKQLIAEALAIRPDAEEVIVTVCP